MTFGPSNIFFAIKSLHKPPAPNLRSYFQIYLNFLVTTPSKIFRNLDIEYKLQKIGKNYRSPRNNWVFSNSFWIVSESIWKHFPIGNDFSVFPSTAHSNFSVSNLFHSCHSATVCCHVLQLYLTNEPIFFNFR